MLCATTTGGAPVVLVMRWTASSTSGTYSSIEPSTGSRLTAMKGTPRLVIRASQPFQIPRLQAKPWMKTTPRVPECGLVRRSGHTRCRNGCRQQKTRNALPISRHHAFIKERRLAAGAGSWRLIEKTARNSAASTPAKIPGGSMAMAKAKPSRPECQASTAHNRTTPRTPSVKAR